MKKRRVSTTLLRVAQGFPTASRSLSGSVRRFYGAVVKDLVDAIGKSRAEDRKQEPVGNPCLRAERGRPLSFLSALAFFLFATAREGANVARRGGKRRGGAGSV